MAYIVESKVRKFCNENNRQITKDGLYAIELKLVEFLSRLCRERNGGRKRIDMEFVNCLNVK